MKEKGVNGSNLFVGGAFTMANSVSARSRSYICKNLL